MLLPLHHPHHEFHPCWIYTLTVAFFPQTALQCLLSQSLEKEQFWMVSVSFLETLEICTPIPQGWSSQSWSCWLTVLIWSCERTHTVQCRCSKLKTVQTQQLNCRIYNSPKVSTKPTLPLNPNGRWHMNYCVECQYDRFVWKFRQHFQKSPGLFVPFPHIKCAWWGHTPFFSNTYCRTFHTGPWIKGCAICNS